MNPESYIFVAGASRGVGREVAKCLRDQQVNVKALLRTPDSRPDLEAMGVKVVMGDALDIASLEQPILGTEPISAVISTIGGLQNLHASRWRPCHTFPIFGSTAGSRHTSSRAS